jgi:hypothetical protein
LTIRENSIGGNNAEIGNSLNNLGQLNFSKGNYSKALELQKKSLELTEKALGPDHLKVSQVNFFYLFFSNILSVFMI